jgi:hypothetical protein
MEPVRDAQLPLPARIVVRIDVVELHRRHAVDLDDRLAIRRCVMMHFRIEIGKAPAEKLSMLAS